MREVSQRLLIFLSVCTIVFIFVLVNIFGFFGGRWYERSAQDEADRYMVFEKNEDDARQVGDDIGPNGQRRSFVPRLRGGAGDP